LKYELFSHAIPIKQNLRCGDYCHSNYFGNENILLLTCSDGVGNHPQHHLAAETACLTFAETFGQTKGNIEGRIKEAVNSANNSVIKATNGANATFMALVWELSKQEVCFISIGDSAIFKVENEKIVKLTEDDSTTIILTQNGKIISNNGMPITKSSITQYLGKKTDLEYSVSKEIFMPGDSMILATDGIHQNGIISDEIINIINSANCDSKLREYATCCANTNHDDATIMLLVNKDCSIEQRNIIIDLTLSQKDYKSTKIPEHLVQTVLFEELEKLAKNGNTAQVENYLRYFISYTILPKQDFIIHLLDFLGQNLNPTILALSKKLLMKVQ
jgi:serine/threonine protein phosphatase PrpC